MNLGAEIEALRQREDLLYRLAEARAQKAAMEKIAALTDSEIRSEYQRILRERAERAQRAQRAASAEWERRRERVERAQREVDLLVRRGLLRP